MADWKQKFDSHLVLVKELLKSKEWVEAGNTDDTLTKCLQRTALIEEAGIEPMKVIHWRKLLELKRIPRSDEGHAIPVREANERCKERGLKMNIRLLSHRWTRAEEKKPDSHENDKAKAVCRFAHYEHTVYGVEDYFWIDYTCVDQDDAAHGIAALPLYVGSTDGIFCYDVQNLMTKSDDYFFRPWCRMEMLMQYVFCTPRAWFYDPTDHETNGSTYKSKLKPAKMPKNGAGYFKLLDPCEPEVLENITNPADLDAIKTLRDLAVEMYPKTREHFIDAHKQFSPMTIDFKNNQSWYWRMEDFVKHQEKDLDGSGWVNVETGY